MVFRSVLVTTIQPQTPNECSLIGHLNDINDFGELLMDGVITIYNQSSAIIKVIAIVKTKVFFIPLNFF